MQENNIKNLLDYFMINIEYDKNEKGKEIYIGKNNSSGVNYKCNNIKEMLSAIQNYAENYLIEEYYIKYWENEYDRDQGFSSTYDEYYNNKDDAIETSRKLFRNNGYASIEVMDTNGEVCYFQDNEEEMIFIDDEQISIVDSKMKKKIYRMLV